MLIYIASWFLSGHLFDPPLPSNMEEYLKLWTNKHISFITLREKVDKKYNSEPKKLNYYNQLLLE